MDPSSLESLKDVLATSPQNEALWKVVIDGYRELDLFQEGYQFIRKLKPEYDFEKEQTRLLIGTFCLEIAPETTLAVCTSGTPEAGMLRARALVSLDRLEEAKSAYKTAVAANAALEDPTLASRIDARQAKQTVGKDNIKLRVISNDDTDQSELNRLLHPNEEKVTFAEVGGLADIKKQIHKRIILPFQKPTIFQRFRKKTGGGILLYGPPGCGKTLLARATAGECGATFFNVAIADVLDMYIGESERKLHAIFEQARQKTPAVLFFDEIEALGGKRQYTREGTSSKLVSQFLAEMDGFQKQNSGILILGATNVPWAVDAAFRRPGRFDRLLFVPPPDRGARAAVLSIHLDRRPVADDLDLQWLAGQTSGYSGADLQELVEAGVDEAIEASLEAEREIPLSQTHLKTALGEVKPTTLEWLTTARNYARYANEGGTYDDVLAFLTKHGKA